MDSLNITSLLASTFMYSTPIIIAALGGLFSERSGIVNIALEGIMLVGAFTAACAQTLLPNPNPWISILAGLGAGVIFSVLHAIASINFKSNQVISGTALNIIASGLTIYLCQLIFKAERSYNFTSTFKKVNIPVLGDIYPTLFVAFALVISAYIILKFTKFGLRLRSCGEYPQASDGAGINVYLYRYFGVLISGGLAGLAGGIMVLTQDTQFYIGSIHGMGFIALASLIFGKWNPFGVLLSGLFFGLATVFSIYAVDINVISNLPTEIFVMIPYVVTIIALIITSKNVSGPKSAGEIYDKGKR